MKKFCVFCGNKPENKSNEHIFPLWLLELTGNPSRLAKHGYTKRSNPSIRKYAFDEFKFPACKECNEKYSDLENDTKNIVKRILDNDSVSCSDFSTFLDWFDKIRVGIWLGFYYLDKNIANIIPHFFITSRLRKYDRMLLITKIIDAPLGINYTDSESLFFYNSPRCLSLRINNFYFLSISFQFLFSHRIGFPYPQKIYYHPDNSLNVDLAPGTERIMMPIIRKPFRVVGTEIYQPIFQEWILNLDQKESFLSDYVKSKSIDCQQGIGKILISKKGALSEYPDFLSKEWMPEHEYSYSEISYKQPLTTLEMQRYLIDTFIKKYIYKSKEFEKQMRLQTRNQIVDINRRIRYLNSLV